MSISKEKQKEYDIYKDSYLRYLGYSNEIGEAFRKVTSSNFVIATYLVEFAYFIGDTTHKAHKAYNNDSSTNKLNGMIIHSSYTILWQFFATCLIPPLCINIVVKYSHKFLVSRSFSTVSIRYIPVSLGLGMIPLLNIYLDPVVGSMLDSIFEKHLL